MANLNLKAYVYSGVFSNTPLKMIKLNLESDALDIKYDDLNNFSIANFSLPLDSGVSKFQKVVIYNGSNEIFTSYVHNEPIPILDKVNKKLTVSCASIKRYLSEIRLLAPINIVNQPVDAVIQELQLQYNSNGFAWTYETDGTLVTKQANIGATWYDVLNDLGLQWTVEGAKIIIKKQIGVNRSFGAGQQQLIYAPYNSNVSEVKVNPKNNNANVVIGKTNAQGTFIYPTPLPAKITGVAFKEFRDGDVQQQTKDYFDTLGVNNLVYSVTAEEGAVEANVGDIISLRIQGFGDFDIVTSVFVIAKTAKYKDGVASIGYEVSEGTAPVEGIIEEIRNLRRDLQIIQTE